MHTLQLRYTPRNIAAALLTGLILCGTACSFAKDAPPPAALEAVIVLSGRYSKDGIARPETIGVVQAATIKKLEAFFPGYRTRPKSDVAGAWDAIGCVYFNLAGGETVRVIVSYDGTHWSTGQGDFDTRGNFAALLKELQQAE